MQLQTSLVGRALVVRCREDRIDAANAAAFRDAMRAEVAGSTGPVVLDLGDVAFLDSSGLGAIVAVMKALAPGRRLELAAPTPNVMRVFRLTRMDSVFTIHERAPGAPEGRNAADAV